MIESVFVFNGLIDNPEKTLLMMEQLANHNKQKLHRNALKYVMQSNAMDDFSSEAQILLVYLLSSSKIGNVEIAIDL